MKALFLSVGAIIAIAGIACLIHPRWASPSSKKEVDIDNHKVIFETTRYSEIPKAWSVVAIVLGGALIFIGTRKQ